MTKQTRLLCADLPHFAELFKAADKRGSAQWQVIRWQDIAPEDLHPDDPHITRLPRLYDSRTEAIQASFEQSKPRRRPERGEKLYDMVCKWLPDERGNVQYQSIMPLGYGRGTGNGTGRPDPVKESSETPTSTPGSTMVRIGEKANAILRRISDEDGKTLQAVLDEALQEYEKQRFFRDLNTFYTDLRADPQAWKEEMEERGVLEGTLMDGIDTDEVWDPETRTATLKGQESRCG